MNNKVTCRYCHTESEVKMKTSFFGFKNFKCPSCKRTNMFPLSKPYKIVYWVIVVPFLLSAVANLSLKGKLGLPSVVAIAGIAALCMNYKYEKEVRGLVK